MQLGLSPREWLGEWTGGPRFDWADRAIVAAWLELQETKCPLCGRPLEMHQQRQDRVEDYDAELITCHATEALDRLQATHRAARKTSEQAAIKAGRHPGRAEVWLPYARDREGRPVFGAPAID